MGPSSQQKTSRRPLKVLSALVLSAWAMPSWALELGKIQLLSAIGEPLRAEVEVSLDAPDEWRNLQAQLAPPNSFLQAGMEFNPALAGLTASVQKRSDGTPFIALQGQLPVKENFIDLILETQWATGRRVKNYAVLLTAVKAGASHSAQASAAPMPAINLPQPSRSDLPAPAAQMVSRIPDSRVELNAQNVPVYRFPLEPTAEVPQPAAVAASEASMASAPVTSPPVATTPPLKPAVSEHPPSMTVKPGDTASAWALRHLPPDVSLDQMLLALLKANPDAFIRGNVNLIKAGAVLKMPTAAQANVVSRSEARQTVIAQNRDFAQYAGRLAESTLLVGERASREMSGQVAQESQAQGSASLQQDKLTLSKAEVLADSEAAKLAAERQTQEASAQLAALDQNLRDLQALTPAATAPSEPASTAPSVSADTAAAPVISAPGLAPASAPVGSVAASPKSEPEDQASLWGWAAALLAGFFLIWMWIRKKSTQPEEVYAPSYDDIEPTPSPEMASPTAATPPLDNSPLASQLASIDLNLHTHDGPGPGAAVGAATPSEGAVASGQATGMSTSADDTENSKLQLASQLLAKGDKDLARALILSVVSSASGELKNRAIQLLGQIR